MLNSFALDFHSFVVTGENHFGFNSSPQPTAPPRFMIRYAVIVFAVFLANSFASPARAQPLSVPLALSHAAESANLGARARASHQLKIHLSFALRNRDQLTKLLADQQDPTSPDYRHWLKPAEFNARFGRTPAEVDSVKRWLSSIGFHVTSSNSRGILGTASVLQAETAFATSIASSDDGKLYANSSDIEIPAQFSEIIAAVEGLDNLRHSSAIGVTARMPWTTSPQSRSTYPASSSIRRKGLVLRTGMRTAPSVQLGAFGTAFGPSDVATFYDEVPLSSAGNTGGAGDCMAFIEDSDYLSASVNLFDSTFSLPAAGITRVFADTSSPGRNNDEEEVLLDLEWGHAVAPGAQIRVYIGNSAHSIIDPLTDSIQKAVSENRCGTISISYGFCGSPGSFYSGTLDPLFMQAASQGQSVFVSSGDDGAAGIVLSGTGLSCVRGTSLNVSEMSASPNVTAVGGTQFDPNYDGSNNDIGNVSESAWNGSFGSTGGGASAVFPKPSYQNSVTPDDNARDVPDISLGSSPVSPGFYLGDDTGGTATMDCCWGGTSIAAPMWSGIAKLTAQAANTARLGNMNPQIYTLGALQNEATSGLRDVTSGNNSFNGVTGYSAGVGYDQSTGWGSADMAVFASAFVTSGGFPTPTPGGPTPTPTPGLGPMNVTPIGISFGIHKVGSATRPRIVRVVNPRKNKQSMTLGSISTSGTGFTVDPTTTTCQNNAVLSEGGHCNVGIIFNPAATGLQTGSLTIGSNALNQPRAVALRGKGK